MNNIARTAPAPINPDNIGVFRNGQFIVDYNVNNAWDNGIDRVYTFGKLGDIPIMGDWDGNGKLKIGVFRNGQFIVDYNRNNAWDNGIDRVYTFGKAGDYPVMGDWT